MGWEKKSNYACFLLLAKVLVDGTDKEHPMTKKEILNRCEELHAPLNSATFHKYLELFEEAGIHIARRLPANTSKGAFLYWYDKGWI